VDEALAKKYFIDPVSTLRQFSLVWGAQFTLRTSTDGCRFVLIEGCGSLWWDAVVGGRVVSLDFLTLLSP
jgi:hypothetical protein